MYLLINTTNNLLQLGLANNKGELQETLVELAEQRQSELLLPSIQQLLGKRKPQAVVCCVGPGSFTGSRIGITTANTMAYGLNIPIASVNNLELLVCRGRKYFNLSNEHDIHGIIDAGRNQVYFWPLQTNLEKHLLTNDNILTIEQLSSLTQNKDSYFIGTLNSQHQRVRETLNQQKNVHLRVDPFNLLQEMVRLGLPRLRDQKVFQLELQLLPLYIREANVTKRKKLQLSSF